VSAQASGYAVILGSHRGSQSRSLAAHLARDEDGIHGRRGAGELVGGVPVKLTVIHQLGGSP